MQIQLLAIGQKLDAWVTSGFQEYAKRMPPECRLQLQEIPASKRGKNADVSRLVEEEGRRLLSVVPKRSHSVALDIQGNMWSTEQLARELEQWLSEGQDVALLVGGPDGLSSQCRSQANQLWSLSPLTLPHPLVRIVVAEQLYRAWSLLKGHPYHR